MDRLTGLADHGDFSASLPTLSARDRISLVVFDVDDLGSLNDRYGHTEVDRVLARFGSLIQARCGAGEIAARLGGDEFALTLLEDEPTEVIREVEHIRRRFGEAIPGATLSVGISDGKTLRRAAVPLSLLEAADGALMDAKTQSPGGLSFFSAG